MRAFCITLPETPERTAKATAHFKERSVQVTFFNGINAEVAGLQTEHLYEVDNPGSGFKIGYHPTGIFLSHWALWSALTLQPDEHFMILEIDAKFHPDWHLRTDAALRDAPSDFDMLFLGSCCCKDAPKKHIKGEIWEVKYPACFHAYVIAKKALPIMLSMRRIFAPVDIQPVWEAYPRMKVLALLPRTVDQFDTVISP